MMIRHKIQWLSFGSLSLLGVTILGVTFLLLSSHFERQEQDRIRQAMIITQHQIDQRLRGLEQGAAFLASEPAILQGIEGRDTRALEKEGRWIREQLRIPVLLFTDGRGVVLARAHLDRSGDSLVQQPAVAEALRGRPAIGTDTGQVVQMAFTAAVPVLRNGRVVGVVLAGSEGLESHAFTDELRSLTGLECTIFKGRTRLSTTLRGEDGARLGGTMLDNPAILGKVEAGEPYIGTSQVSARTYTAAYWPLRDAQGKVSGMAFIGQDRSHIAQAYLRIFLGILFSVLIFAVVIWFILRRLLKRILLPIGEVASVLREVARGNLQVRVEHMGHDETGVMGCALNETVEHLRRNIGDMASISEQVAAGAAQLASSTEQVVEATVNIHQGAGVQQEALGQSSQDLGRLAGAVAGIHNDSGASAEAAERIAQVSSSCRQEMDASLRSMERILESSGKVGNISGLISGIARQTNLLSLNAAIEAAKAGQFGKGFAVVADEIRKLAERSGDAAREISELIEESGARARQGAESVAAMDGILRQIEAHAQACSDLARKTTGTLEEQAALSRHAAQATLATREVAEGNAAAAFQLKSATQETRQTVGALSALSEKLATMTAEFRLG
nr:methyl-accepting chemotaxis protein [uncultured Holophaga sp.]